MKIYPVTRASLIALLTLSASIFLPSSALAQSLAAGLPPYGSFQPGGFDTVNRQNANVFFTIPIVHAPGRGMNFDFSLIYNSSFWARLGGSIPYWAPVGNSFGYPIWGWSTTKFAGGSVSHQTSATECQFWDDNGNRIIEWTSINYNYIYTDGSGATHNLGISYYISATDCGFDPVGP